MGEFMYNLRNGRLFGLPVWMVGVGGALLIVGFVWWRGRSGATSSTTAPAVEDPGYAYDGNVGLTNDAIGDYLADDPTNPAYPVGSNAQGIPGPITNVQWSRLAADYLISKGSDPSLVSNALAKYLDGKTLTAAEQAIINMALTAFGSPPEGLILVNTSPNAPSNQPQPGNDTPGLPDLPEGWTWSRATNATWYGRNVPVSQYQVQEGDTWAIIASKHGGLEPWGLYLFNGGNSTDRSAYDRGPTVGTQVAIPHP